MASMIGVDLRLTMDLDAPIQGYPMTEPAIEEAVLNILAIPRMVSVWLSNNKVV